VTSERICMKDRGLTISACAMRLNLDSDIRAFAEDDNSDNRFAENIVDGHVWIGAGPVVLAGVTIGARAVVGAGTSVNRNFPAGTVVAGGPAQPVERTDGK